MPASSRAQQILLPASGKFILFTLLCALILNLLPWQGYGLLLRPDFIALALLFWCIHHPRRLGMTAAFVLGLLIDVADGALLGQHALAYTIMVYLALLLRRRILMFPLQQQALHIFPLLLALQLITLFIKFATGTFIGGWGILLTSATSTLLWPPLSFLLQIPQRKSPKSEPI
jgi:rod shape-determining protein MreD